MTARKGHPIPGADETYWTALGHNLTPRPRGGLQPEQVSGPRQKPPPPKNDPSAWPVGDPSKRPPCSCPTCRIARAVRELDAAHDVWLDDAHETEMALAYLRDEIDAVSRSWRGWFVRRRLREALRVAAPLRATYVGYEETAR